MKKKVRTLLARLAVYGVFSIPLAWTIRAIITVILTVVFGMKGVEIAKLSVPIYFGGSLLSGVVILIYDYIVRRKKRRSKEA